MHLFVSVVSQNTAVRVHTVNFSLWITAWEKYLNNECFHEKEYLTWLLNKFLYVVIMHRLLVLVSCV